MSAFLIPVDALQPSKAALDYLIALISFDGEPHLAMLLYVQDTRPLTIPIAFDSQPAQPIDELPTDEPGVSLLRGYSHLLEKAGYTVRALIAHGSPVDEILSAADRFGADAIVMPTSGASRSAHLLLGSVAYRLLHRSKIPVTLMHNKTTCARAPRAYWHVLLPVDGSQQSQAALETAARRFAICQDKVHLVVLHVQPPSYELPGRFASYEKGLDELHARYAHEAIENACAGLQTWEFDFETRVVISTPALGIVDTARALNIDEIVMGTHGRGALTHAVLGSVAFSVVHLSDRPVTLIR